MKELMLRSHVKELNDWFSPKRLKFETVSLKDKKSVEETVQILLEAGLLPGAMMRNAGLRFICRTVTLRVERTNTPFTNRFHEGQVVRMPIAHNEGNYTADAATLKMLKQNRQVLFRYCDADGQVTEAANPNGSTDAIAGLCNADGNVMGLMPHPERASMSELGSVDGRLLFESILESRAMAQSR